jgi:hypothetical protein
MKAYLGRRGRKPLKKKCMKNNNNWLYFVRKPGEMKAKIREKNRMFF